MTDKDRPQGRKLSDAALGTPRKTPEPTAADRIKFMIPNVQINMDILRDPMEAMLKWGFEQRAATWYANHVKELVRIVAEKTGADPAQIENPETRTLEQSDLLAKLAAAQVMHRFDKFMKSAYYSALTFLALLKGTYPDPAEVDPDHPENEDYFKLGEYISVKEQAALYFFAAHSELKPTDPVELTPEHLAELRGIFERLDALYMERTEGGSYDPNTLDILFEFIDRENPAPEVAQKIARIISSPTDLLTYPVDKPNSKLWNMFITADPNGQLEFKFLTGKKGDKETAVTCAINFDDLGDDLQITKQLTPFDKRVYIAAAALFNGGNDVFSATQIYKMMGNRGQPKADQIQKINDSLTKMGAARIYLNNDREAGTKYARFSYDASLLPFERQSAYINNTLTESAIHLFREPPLISFARERKQITRVTRQLLESPINKTNANLVLEDYLLEHIGRMKNAKAHAPRKMLLETIYANTNIKTAKQKQRAPEKIQRYLDHYQKCGWIAGYTMDKDSITIKL